MNDVMTSTRSTASAGLSGRNAIITGSTSGIGLGIAQALAKQGANVALNGFGDAAEIEKVRAGIERASGAAAIYVNADMSSPGEITRMVEEAERRLGSVDILVSNAGIQHVAPIEEFPVEKWNAIIAINLSAVFHATRAVLGGMKSRGFGRIVNIASAHGLVGSPFKSAYVAAKHGVIGLTKVTALEAAEHGVTCNAICPGYVWTPLVEKQIDEQARSHGIKRGDVIRNVLLAQQPNRAFATVEEVGALTAFLCSEGGRSITGAALPLDGGWTAH
jgi:3-hydroxybutyrate dehydrogenase